MTEDQDTDRYSWDPGDIDISAPDTDEDLDQELESLDAELNALHPAFRLRVPSGD